MTPTSIAVRIWARTIIVNAFLWAAGSFFVCEIPKVFISFILLIGGFIVTLPLLMLISPLVSLSRILPYSIPAKTAWLTFFLSVLIIMIYGSASMIIDDTVFEKGSVINWLMTSTLGGLLFAILTTRKSLKELYSEDNNI